MYGCNTTCGGGFNLGGVGNCILWLIIIFIVLALVCPFFSSLFSKNSCCC